MTDKETRIHLKAYEHHTLDTAAKKTVEAVTHTDATIAGPVPLPAERSLHTVIHTAHKYRDSCERSGVCTHKRLIDIINLAQKTVDASMRLGLPGSANVKIKLQ